MKCYTHSDRDGVAICQHCGKALCQPCTIEVSGKISCRGVCEKEVELLNFIIKKGKPSLQSNEMAFLYLSAMTLIGGLLLLGLGFYEKHIQNIRILCFVAGPISLIFSFYFYKVVKKLREG